MPPASHICISLSVKAGSNRFWYFSSYFFSLQCENILKNPFSDKLSYLYLQSKDKKNIVFSPFFLSGCLLRSFTYLFLLNMSLWVLFKILETSPTTVLVFSKFPKPSRRPFWSFRNFRNVPDGCFYSFEIFERAKTTDFALLKFSKPFLYINNL